MASNLVLFTIFSFILFMPFGLAEQCTLKDAKLKCGAATCQVTMGSPKILAGKYRIGKVETVTSVGMPSPPYHYLYKAINNDPSKGYWAEMTFIPEMRCSKETPWMNSDALAVAHSIGVQSSACYNSTIKPVLSRMQPKEFQAKVCPSKNACESGQCANLASMGSMKREYLTDLVVV